MPADDLATAQQLLTRREAAAMRTVSRRIEAGTLNTAYRSSGQRGIVAASVTALLEADATLATEALGGSQSSATTPAPDAVAVAVAYGVLAQAVRAHLDAGLLNRRATREQLRDALERSAGAVAPMLEAGGSLDTLLALPAVPPAPSEPSTAASDAD
jgi:hypothetical protein